ncbi:MAG TPA: RNA-binding S4 domain-containing protein [Pyrinomonadaceae bacterium]|nr:RNA-binding S4 domain-containing protein [Pyrinomonadaceae bacterium]
MRLDLFLKISRLVLRRSLAQELCDAGRISVNGAVAKSSKEVKAGDTIEIRRRERVTNVSVNTIPTTKQVAKQSAGELYRLVSNEAVDDALF